MEQVVNKACRAFGALSDIHRLRLLLALRRGERCVCQLIALMGLAPSTVSKHLSILRDAGWLASRKQGRWVYYRLAEPLPFPMFGTKAAPFFQALEKSPAAMADARRLRRIAEMDAEVLCRKIMGR
ncbi:MAG: helix-turn-helix transcriptional regulator [Kiritimatiellae bacterium]|nr:helix-turn-helix transcriptional regulator [Kiritimatiellia bacterium]